MSREYVLKTFPEIGEIKDEELREKVVEAYVTAMERGGWTDLSVIPFTLIISGLKKDYIEHIRKVTGMAMAVASKRDDLDWDLVVAGGLLHDVGKLLEYAMVDGKVGKSENGKLLRHPVSGAALVMELGLPDKLAHILAAHSKEGELVKRIPEAILIYHCDFIDFEIEKHKYGM